MQCPGHALPHVGVSVDEGTGVGGQVGELAWGSELKSS
jgi:hypothetical protein